MKRCKHRGYAIYYHYGAVPMPMVIQRCSDCKEMLPFIGCSSETTDEEMQLAERIRWLNWMCLDVRLDEEIDLYIDSLEISDEEIAASVSRLPISVEEWVDGVCGRVAKILGEP